MERISLRNENGVALIIALIMLLILTLIGISSINTTTFETKISGNQRMGTDAFYASEAGVQVGLNQIPEITPISKSKIGTDTYYSGTVSFVGWAQNVGHDQTWSFKRFQVNGTGESLGASKQIEVQARFGPFPSGTGYNN